MISYDDLHKFHKRATPMKYRLSIQLFKIWNGESQNDDWVDMNFQQNFNARVDFIQIIETSKLKIGKNIIMNRLSILSRLIKYDWLNLSLNSFKIKVKDLFKTNWTTLTYQYAMGLITVNCPLFFLNRKYLFTLKINH